MRAIGEPSPGDYESSLSREGDPFSFFLDELLVLVAELLDRHFDLLAVAPLSVTKPFATRTNLALMWVPLVLVHVR